MHSGGFILLQTVIVTLLLNLIAFTLVSLTLRTAEIEQLHHTQRQAYWLARSEAVTVIRQLQVGATPVNHTVIVGGDSTVAVSVVPSPTQITVAVTGRVHQSVDRIYFSYNPSTRLITSWLDASN